MLPDPMGERRNPFQVYMLVICVISGFAAIIGHVPSNAVAAELSRPYQIVWGAMLFIGGVTVLAGMYWQWDARDGLVMKRLGLMALTFPPLVYGIALIFGTGLGGFFAGFISIGFSMATAIQWWRVEKHIDRAVRDTP